MRFGRGRLTPGRLFQVVLILLADPLDLRYVRATGRLLDPLVSQHSLDLILHPPFPEALQTTTYVDAEYMGGWEAGLRTGAGILRRRYGCRVVPGFHRN